MVQRLPAPDLRPLCLDKFVQRAKECLDRERGHHKTETSLEV